MDCDTARLFLQFCRPGHNDLGGDEEADLEKHLADCTQCNALAMGQQRIDQHLGRAMRAVDPPQGLHDRILDRLAAERSSRHRLWAGYAVSGAVAAAVVVLACGVVWYAFFYSPVPRINTDLVLQAFNIAKPDAERANELLKQLGARPCASDHFNFAHLLAGPSLALLPGYEAENVKVPQFVFAQNTREGRQLAVVFAIDERRHQVADLEESDHGYPFRLAVYRPNTWSRYAYLVFHNGKGDDGWKKWLLRPDAGQP